jgi:signal transduction histidine kinase
MSAVAPAILVEPPAYFHAPPVDAATTEAIRDLVHELRQPLSAIEAIAYYVEMTLPPDQLQARQHMRRLQELVGRAESALSSSVSTARKPPAGASTAAGAS